MRAVVRSIALFVALALMTAPAFAGGRNAPTAQAGFLEEIKIGGLYHDVGGLWSGFSLERESVDINLEVVTVPIWRMLGGTVHAAAGGTINVNGDTSFGYLDARWQIGAPVGLFFSVGVGAAIHDGLLTPTEPDRKALGSRVLFHFPFEIGWRLDRHNAVSIYFEHVSNANTARVNEGMDHIGVRYGHRF